jgi:hypothetical protein
MTKRLGAALAFLLCAFNSSTVKAERLNSIWTLEPESNQSQQTVTYGKQFFIQKLLPLKSVKLDEDAGGSATTGTLLYLVFTDDHQIAFCTFKDLSAKHAASSLFIPILDRRPCFVDRDGDGKFEASFSVFDKYGSMATPSGNLSDAKPLPRPVAYEAADPHLAPHTMRIAFVLGGGQQPERARVDLVFDKAGKDQWEALEGPVRRNGRVILVANSRVTIDSVVDKTASVRIDVDSAVLLTGGSGGALTTTALPPFVE